METHLNTDLIPTENFTIGVYIVIIGEQNLEKKF